LSLGLFIHFSQHLWVFVNRRIADRRREVWGLKDKDGSSDRYQAPHGTVNRHPCAIQTQIGFVFKFLVKKSCKFI
jgi:hypothetical protein